MSIRVCSFESRRHQEMATLITKFGGLPVVAPSMREIPLEENVIAGKFAQRLIAGEFEMVIFMTGVGAATLFDAVRALGLWEQFQPELDKRQILIRGPKPVPILKENGIHIDFRATEPNTWREVLQLLETEQIPLSGKTIAVQEYGKPNQEFYDILEARGAAVFPVPVYRWDYPLDIEPLNTAIREAVANPFDIVLFTSANQVDNVVEAAEKLGLRDSFLNSLKQSCIASIGPTCTERLQEFQLPPHLEPSHPKMAHLIRESLEYVTQSKEPEAKSEE